MFSIWTLLATLSLYIGGLFLLALWADRREALGGGRLLSRRWVYSLAIAVYCTSWTFYGAVGRASDSLWSYVPIYLGPLLVFTLGAPLLRRMVDGVQHHNLTSVADFVAARYGRDRFLATLATVVCVVAVVPYIALQLRGIAIGVAVVAETDSSSALNGEGASAFFAAICLAIFAILFGTRHASSRDSQQGLLVAVAFESLVKLIAFIAVGLLAWSQLGSAALVDFVERQPGLLQSAVQPSFITQTLLAAIAIICLPRQFHVTAVEYKDPAELRLARIIFPLYLVAICLLVLPIVALGLAALPAGSAPDSFVLLLPKSLNEPAITLLVFIGGVSAASAMVIVSSIALGTMISNEIVLPRLVGNASQPQNYAALVRRSRRFSIIVIVGLAYGFYLLTSNQPSLAAIGLLAFVGIAQLAPAMLLGMFWAGASRAGAIAGLSIGAVLWFWTMLLPALVPGLNASLQAVGLPLWVTPDGFLGLSGVDSVTRAAWSSLSANTIALLLVSWMTNHRPEYHRDAGRFLLPGSVGAVLTLDPKAAQHLLAQFFGQDQAREVAAQPEFGEGSKPTYERAAYCERLLSGVMGAATARRLVAEYSRSGENQAEEVLNYATQMVDFSRELLQASLQNIGVAVSVIDANQRLVGWNDEYQKLFGFPANLLKTGVAIDKLVRFNAERGLLGAGNADALIKRRLQKLKAAHPYRHERALPDGRYLEIRGAPMPGGGFITTFTDISAYKELQHTLETANAGLEVRVVKRTAELQRLNETLSQEVMTRRQAETALSEAKALAEQANASKTHFLAAATHDLMQPLNSARLFSAVLTQEASGSIADTAANIEQSLESMEQMLSTLLDISKLDAGVLPVNRRAFTANELLLSVQSGLHKTVESSGATLTVMPCSATIDSDPAHLRRILQNFVVNALRYSGSGGRVLLGARRRVDGLRFEVWDNGPGISEDQQELIFEEFRRGGDGRNSDHAIGPRGSGLGLSISRRLADLLKHKIGLRSQLGKGSVFSITVPYAAADSIAAGVAIARSKAGVRRFDGVTVLCIDNERQVLAGMNSLLGSWGCHVTLAESGDGVADSLVEPPALMLVDFHLEDGVRGTDVIAELRLAWRREVPAVLITADYTEEAKAAAEQAGVQILRKPLKPAALGALMGRLLSA